MTSKERVFKALEHQEPDRVPLNIWMYRDDVQKTVEQRYGSLDDFYDALHIDMMTAFPTYLLVPPGDDSSWTGTKGLDDALDLAFTDPNQSHLYDPIREYVRKYGNERAVFCQTQGVFEGAFSLCGMEELLPAMVLEREKVDELFRKIADWSCVYVNNILDIGIDVPHISDDWGQNNSLLISPTLWWEMVYQHDKEIVDTAKRRCKYVSLHSDGYVYDVLEGVVQMGIDAIHPIQVSAGMDPVKVKERFGKRLTLYGTLDITHTLPFGTDEEIEREVKERMSTLKDGGGFIFCSTHTIQPDTPLEKVEFAYRIAHEFGRY